MTAVISPLFGGLLGMDWAKALDQFADYQRAANLSETTIKNREECLLLLGRRRRSGPLEVSKQDLIAHLGRPHPRTGQPLAAGTKQSERSYMQVFFSWLNAEGIRPDDPALTLPKVKMPRRQPRPFRLEQVDRMITSGAYRRTRDMISLAALTGLRIGEIVRIRGEHVDYEERLIHTLRKGGFQHTVAVPSHLEQLLERYPHTGWWFPSPYRNELFPEGGGHILMRSASDDMSRAMRRAGITDPRLTGHSLRHFFATTLLHEGVNIRIVQELLGHASLATTQLYTLVTDQEKVAGVQNLPRIQQPVRSGRVAA